jgi:hypothetical protein
MQQRFTISSSYSVAIDEGIGNHTYDFSRVRFNAIFELNLDYTCNWGHIAFIVEISRARTES